MINRFVDLVVFFNVFNLLFSVLACFLMSQPFPSILCVLSNQCKINEVIKYRRLRVCVAVNETRIFK